MLSKTFPVDKINPSLIPTLLAAALNSPIAFDAPVYLTLKTSIPCPTNTFSTNCVGVKAVLVVSCENT